MMIKRILSLLLLAFLLSGANIVKSNNNIYDISLKTIDGKTISLLQFKGKIPIYLKFWASWCQPCRKQMPHLQHAYETYKDKIEIIAINIDMNDSREAISRVIAEFNLSLPIIVDQNARLSQTFNLTATPFHILIDKNGTIVHKGHEASAQLDQKLSTLASKNSSSLVETKLVQNKKPDLNLNINNTTTLLYFSSAWCDWYLKDSRPVMSSNCINAQHQVNRLYEQYPNLNWIGVLTRLWTGEQELQEYQKKYNIKHPLHIDHNNSEFIKYSVSAFPTLIAIKKGKEVFRLHDFDDEKSIISRLESL